MDFKTQQSSRAVALLFHGLRTSKHEYILAFSCKGRWFCPSCHQKKVHLFGELLSETILYPVPHRHFTLGIPKMLRPYFRFDRDLLKELCRIDFTLSFLRRSGIDKETASGCNFPAPAPGTGRGRRGG